MNNLSIKKIALVYDWVDKWGGAERVLLVLHEMFPDAPLYTGVYDPVLAPWAKVFPKIYAPKINFKHEWFPGLFPLIFESYNFDQYDLVISVSSFAAKGIITKPTTKHLCYLLTPTRFLWSHYEQYSSELGVVGRFLAKPIFKYLKYWDKLASNRPDKIVSISKTVQARTKTYYGLDSEVVYPPVSVEDYSLLPKESKSADFFLYIGRLIAYKQIEMIVEVFNDLKWPLKIIGTGKLEPILQQKAQDNITFLGNLPDAEMAGYLQTSRGLIYFHEEDFGIVPVEAMAAGVPVIGLNLGGVTETVIHGQTGYLGDDLKSALLEFVKMKFDRKLIQDHAQTFSKNRFKKEFMGIIGKL